MHTASATLQKPQWVEPVDLDGDGDVDFVAASKTDDATAWIENVGEPDDDNPNLYWTTRIIGTATDSPHFVLPYDVDGDGAVDVLSAGRLSDTVDLYLNYGQNSYSFALRVVDDDANLAMTAAAADVDGDGDVDVLTADERHGTMSWWENDGDASFTERMVDGGTAGWTYSVLLVDVDGDGAQDVVAVSRDDYGLSASGVAWYQQVVYDDYGLSASGVAFHRRAIDDGAAAATAVAAADIDGDGNIDVVAATEGSVDIFYNATATTNGSVWAAQNLAIDVEVYSLDVGDVDGDGNADILMPSSQTQGVWAYFYHDGAWERDVVTKHQSYPRCARLADVDLDGDVDVVVAASWDGVVAWHEHDCETSAPTMTPAPSVSPTSSSPTTTFAPTMIPTPNPSYSPTSIPTAAPKVTALPDEGSSAVTKPNSDHFTLHLINLSGEQLGPQCVRDAGVKFGEKKMYQPAVNVSVWNTTSSNHGKLAGLGNATVVVAPNASWSSTNVSLGHTVHDLDETIVFTLTTRGATPGTYTYIYYVGECGSSEENDPLVKLTYDVIAEADAGASVLNLVRGTRPVLGESWAGAYVDARDVDGDAVSDGSPDVAATFFILNERGAYAGYAVCATIWSDARASVLCDVPADAPVGIWNLTARLDGDVIGSREVRVACPPGVVEVDGECEDCPDGGVCDAADLRLEALSLEAGWWRASRHSVEIYECASTDACVGSNETGDESCAEGHGGVICGVCAAGYSAGRKTPL